MTHGSTSHRRVGSMGSTTTPGRVWKGHHLPGHMGARRHTELGLRVLQVDAERNLFREAPCEEREALYYLALASNVPLESRLNGFARLMLQLLATAPLVAAAGVSAVQLRRRLAEPPSLILVAWAAGSLFGVASSGRFFPHYLIQLLPAFALLAAPAAESAWQGLRAGRRPQRRVVAIWAALFLSCLYFNLSVFLHTTPEGRHVAKYPDAQAHVSIESRALADYVRAETHPDQTILNWGRETQLYFYADRKPATRYLYDRPFWQDPPTFGRAMAELRAHPPVLILDSLPPPGLGEPYAKYHPQAFLDFVAKRYDYIGRVEFAEVYRLREESRTGASSHVAGAARRRERR